MLLPSEEAKLEASPAADRAATALMASPNMSSLEDVQRELDGIKAERRRRQRELYTIRPSRSLHTASSSATTTATTASRRSPLATDSSSLSSSILNDHTSGISSERRLAAVKGEATRPAYVPKTGVPPQLLEMAYVTQPGGRLLPSPEHVMGGPVQTLDLSPWDTSSEQTGALCHKNRCLDARTVFSRLSIAIARCVGLVVI